MISANVRIAPARAGIASLVKHKNLLTVLRAQIVLVRRASWEINEADPLALAPQVHIST